MTFAPICVGCQREMRCKKNDCFFLDYQAAAIWAGDRYECEGCTASIVVGVGREPVRKAGEPGFDAVRRLNPDMIELTRESETTKGVAK